MSVLARPNPVLDAKNVVLRLIETGALPADGRLPSERDLANECAVSRRHVRIALDALEAEGLVWRRQGKGTFAGQPADPTGDLAARITGETDALQVMEARLCIEPELAALCAIRMTADEARRLHMLARRRFEATDPHATELWDSAFHRLIAQCARNKPLLTAFALLDKIRSNPDWVAMRAKARSSASLTVTHSEHTAIVDAIAARHSDMARTAMRDHLATRFTALRDACIQLSDDPQTGFAAPTGAA